ncbi:MULTISPECIES: outer membrane beta-barrel protein [Niastella]|uniref:Outer membrane beta-barrel protein n=1 Tax=Niastella soli TaxID=2821487 RepID=A0ABS3YQ62_9BACT|nr:outer membrane beta-barrel protein [Niastella soli]MBO9200056.1 outer membrane beta-barrel protein [Niastella soli]
MKQVIILLIGISMCLTGLAQTDSTANTTDSTARPENENDTIRVGGMIIIKKHKNNEGDNNQAKTYKRSKPSRVSTNWWIIDLGFANYNDQTDYKSSAIQGPDGFAPGLGKDQFKLRAGKSVNVSIYPFMQKLNIYKGAINLKYGLGIELNNYRYNEPILYHTSPTQVVLDLDRNYSKNKLAADYVTLPIMLNFNFTPHRVKQGFGFSIGMSGGYLYSSRQKTITNIDGKEKNHDDFDLHQWKLQYIAELGLGPVKLYGSYATESMFAKGLDQRPYNFGLRLSNW